MFPIYDCIWYCWYDFIIHGCTKGTILCKPGPPIQFIITMNKAMFVSFTYRTSVLGTRPKYYDTTTKTTKTMMKTTSSSHTQQLQEWKIYTSFTGNTMSVSADYLYRSQGGGEANRNVVVQQLYYDQSPPDHIPVICVRSRC
jgi:hypothetical protein